MISIAFGRDSDDAARNAVNKILRRLGNKIEFTILRDKSGRPYVKGINVDISISHENNLFIAVAEFRGSVIQTNPS